MNVPWQAATAAAIGADWLLAAIAPAGDFGRRARAAESAFRPGDEAAAEHALLTVDALAREITVARLEALHAGIAAAPDPGAAIARAAAGGVLDDADFFELSRFLDALEEVVLLANHPLLAATAPIADMAELRALLAPGRTAERTFYLSDAFGTDLAVARMASAAAQARYDVARTRLAERAARQAGVDHVRDGEFVLLRERVAGPLAPEIRIVREAPTYFLCELALDAPALEALAERDRANERVAVCEEALRERLSARVAPAAPALETARSALGTLDLLVARARFARRHACVVPHVERKPAAGFQDARYLPLIGTLGERDYVPVSLDLAGVGVVTGPNMGGKTAALRTLGFLVACVALGVPVPAAHARLPLVDEIVWLGLGDSPEEGALLSAFGSEVVEVRALLEKRPAPVLVLVDEFARTTSPREGRALLIALVETLTERGAVGLAATHFTGVAASARAPHYAVGGLRPFAAANDEPLELRVALERIAHATDYRLMRVDEEALPQADALALAAALGLEPALIARARSAL